MLTRLNTLHPPPREVLTLHSNYFFVSKNVRRWNQHLTSCNALGNVQCTVIALDCTTHNVEICINASNRLARWLGRCLESGCQRTKRFCTTSRRILSAPSFYKYIGHTIVSKGSYWESFCIMLLLVKPLRVTHMNGHLNIFSP